jgi:hypothetical protein
VADLGQSGGSVERWYRTEKSFEKLKAIADGKGGRLTKNEAADIKDMIEILHEGSWDRDGQVRALHIEPGDTVVYTYPEALTRQQAEAIQEQHCQAIGPDVRAIVIAGGLEMAVRRDG